MEMEVYEDKNDELRVEIKDFKDLVATTMTCGVGLMNPEINLLTTFWLLPITRVPPLVIKKKKKNAIPFLPDKPGSFISVRGDGKLRGLRRSLSGKSFSHSITIDLCTTVKALNVKLAPQTIHICGATSKAVAIEGAQIIIDELARIQQRLEFIKHNRKLSHTIGEYVKKLVKGERTSRIMNPQTNEKDDKNEDTSAKDSLTNHTNENDITPKEKPPINIVIRIQDHAIKNVSINYTTFYRSFLDFQIQYEKANSLVLLQDANGKIISSNDTLSPLQKVNMMESVLSDIGLLSVGPILFDYYPIFESEYLLAQYFLKYAEEFDYYSDYTKKILWVLRVCDYFDDTKDNRMCCGPNIKVGEFYEYMTNYNFAFNFTIDRYNLAKTLNHRDGFFSRYDNSIHHSVTVELPINPNDITPVKNGKKKQKNDVPCWRWLVYKSGNVTMSSRTSSGANEAYTKFMSIIAENIEDIRVSEN